MAVTGASTMLLVGFLLGLRHATEADHVAAVATLVARQHSLAQTARQGAAWGLGHGLTLLIIGAAVLAVGVSIPDGVAKALELAVAVMLVALGVDLLWRPSPRHAGGREGRGTPWRALAVGMMHGMAGSAALVMLSLATARSWTVGLLYIALFGLGSMLGMTALSAAMAVPLHFGARAVAGLHHGLRVAVALFSCGLGGAIAWRIAG